MYVYICIYIYIYIYIYTRIDIHDAEPVEPSAPRLRSLFLKQPKRVVRGWVVSGYLSLGKRGRSECNQAQWGLKYVFNQDVFHTAWMW